MTTYEAEKRLVYLSFSLSQRYQLGSYGELGHNLLLRQDFGMSAHPWCTERFGPPAVLFFEYDPISVAETKRYLRNIGPNFNHFLNLFHFISLNFGNRQRSGENETRGKILA